jgi:hypothetical protein
MILVATLMINAVAVSAFWPFHHGASTFWPFSNHHHHDRNNSLSSNNTVQINIEQPNYPFQPIGPLSETSDNAISTILRGVIKVPKVGFASLVHFESGQTSIFFSTFGGNLKSFTSIYVMD